MLVVAAGAAILGGYMRIQHLPIRDPLVRGWLAILFQTIPQLFLAAKIIEEGPAGLPLLAVIAGHATVLSRLALVMLALREARWDRNRRWLCVTETANELGWLVVTLTWLYRGGGFS